MRLRSLGERYYDHYERFFRWAPTAAVVFDSGRGDPSIQVLTYSNVFEGCEVFVTLGATHYQRELGGALEFICCVDAFFDAVPLILASVVGSAATSGVRLAGECVLSLGGIDPEFERASGKSALFFGCVQGVPEEFGDVADAPGAQMRAATFISRAEADMFVRAGAKPLKDAFVAAHVDPFDVRRPSVC